MHPCAAAFEAHECTSRCCVHFASRTGRSAFVSCVLPALVEPTTTALLRLDKVQVILQVTTVPLKKALTAARQQLYLSWMFGFLVVPHRLV